MPTYEYVCGACGHKFEAFQSMTEKSLSKCPKCKKPKAKRLIGSGAGFIFKGAGFYATDYRKKSKSEKSEKSEKPACPSSNQGCHACPHQH